jgi:hypothetical protein
MFPGGWRCFVVRLGAPLMRGDALKRASPCESQDALRRRVQPRFDECPAGTVRSKQGHVQMPTHTNAPSFVVASPSKQPPSATHEPASQVRAAVLFSPPSRRAARHTCQPALRDQDLCRPTHERTYVCFSGASRTSLISLFIETLSYPSLLVQEAGKDSKYPFLG